VKEEKLARGKEKRFKKIAQKIIGYDALFENGICAITDRLFSSTIKFNDINYTEADREDKIDVFAQYCDFLN